MSNVSKSPAAFRFVNFAIVESHFVLRAKGEIELNVDISPAGRVDTTTGVFLLQLKVAITDKKIDPSQFVIEVICEARFEFSNLDDNALPNYIIVNAPAIVFPHVRSYIATLTAQSGRINILLPTFNLSGLSDVLRDNIKQIE